MHIFWKVTVLLVTHVGIIVTVALLTVQRDSSTHQQRAFDDPWYRVGLQLSPWGKTPPAGLPPLAHDLEALAEGFPQSTKALVSLVAHLHGLDNGGHLDEKGATRACRQLGWSRCEKAGLQQLREVLLQGVR